LAHTARRAGDDGDPSLETDPAHAVSSSGAAGTGGAAGAAGAAGRGAVRWAVTRPRIFAVTGPGASTGVMWPTPGSSVSPRQCGSAAASDLPCTGGGSRSRAEEHRSELQ